MGPKRNVITPTSLIDSYEFVLNNKNKLKQDFTLKTIVCTADVLMTGRTIQYLSNDCSERCNY